MAGALKLERELAAITGMTAKELRERWDRLGEGSPPQAPPSILRYLLAQRLQERRNGGLPALVARELERVAREGPKAVPSPRRVAITPGTRLIREWNGRTITVDVLEDGFAYDERTWRSLSEVARHVTGAHWSGPRFFGLTSHG